MDINFVFGVLLVIVAVTETILSIRWSPFYFIHGIKIYSKEIDFNDLSTTSNEVKKFITNLNNASGFLRYTGKEIDDGILAFRKKMISVGFYRNDFENIHGSVIVDPETMTVKINGYENWTFVFFLIYLMPFLFPENGICISTVLSVLLFPLILFVLSFAFERRKYKKLTARIAELVR